VCGLFLSYYICPFDNPTHTRDKPPNVVKTMAVSEKVAAKKLATFFAFMPAFSNLWQLMIGTAHLYLSDNPLFFLFFKK
jgi:hypothetical protein